MEGVKATRIWGLHEFRTLFREANSSGKTFLSHWPSTLPCLRSAEKVNVLYDTQYPAPRH